MRGRREGGPGDQVRLEGPSPPTSRSRSERQESGHWVPEQQDRNTDRHIERLRDRERQAPC